MGVMLELSHLHNNGSSTTTTTTTISGSRTINNNNNGLAPRQNSGSTVTTNSSCTIHPETPDSSHSQSTTTTTPVTTMGKSSNNVLPPSSLLPHSIISGSSSSVPSTIINSSSYLVIFATILLTYVTKEYFTPLDSPIVDTSHGKVQGFISSSRDGRQYYEYLGIPYAQPPVGQLRFEPPAFPQKWAGIRKTTKFGSECVQLEIMVTGKLVGDEDCLFLNVYTPWIEKNPNNLLPVMVYIHGGLFMAGSANMYRGKYFMDQDVVLVTFNYRLAALGFMNTGDELVRGNMGLKDQNMALKWVQQNIASFGGDPRKVTLFGESAGGASVHYHILSPLSKNLFHKALSQSGTALKPWALTKEPVEQARKLARQFGCLTNSTMELVRCLRTVPARKLVQAHMPAMSTLRDPLDTFVPTIEEVIRPDTFLAADPNELVKAGTFNQVPWLTGVNAAEGLLNVGRLLSEKSLMKRVDREWFKLAPILFSYDPRNFYASEEIKNYYFGNSFYLDPAHSVENFTKLFSDRNFFQGTHKAAIQHSKKAPVYLYYLSYSGQITLFNLFKWISPQLPFPVELQVAGEVVKELFSRFVLGRVQPNYGPCHADELPLLFNMHFFAEIRHFSKDYSMSKSLVKLWTDFAKDDSHMKYKNTYWPPIDSNQTTSLKYLNLNEFGGLIDEPFAHRLKFWDSLRL